MNRPLLAALTLALIIPPAAAHPPAPGKTLEHAGPVLDELNKDPLKGIPPQILADAQGVAIIARVIKAGASVSGHGVLFARGKDGKWGDPVFVEMGGSGRFHASVEEADVVLVFHTRAAVDRLLTGSGKLTFGKDVPVEAGPLGRQPAGQPEAPVASYSHASGVFAGVSIAGTTMRRNADADKQFVQPGHEAERRTAEVLKAKLLAMSQEKPAPAAPVAKP